MRKSNDRLAKDILEAAKAEFLQNGYRRASVRSVAAAAGVTTGALYCYYANKEALFDALVEEPAQELYQRYRSDSEAFISNPPEQQLTLLAEADDTQNEHLYDFIYEHYDAFKLIACCAGGTKYEDYIERLTAVEETSSTVMVRRMKECGLLQRYLDETLIHVIAGMQFAAMFEVIAHDDTVEKAKQHMQDLKKFYTAGWYRILGIA